MFHTKNIQVFVNPDGHEFKRAKWNWFKFSIDFDEGKAKLGKVSPPRRMQNMSQEFRKRKMKAEEQHIKSILDTRLRETADRSIDLVYGMYAERFDRLRLATSIAVSYAVQFSKGEWTDLCNQILMNQQVIEESIEDAHKSGLSNQLENSKRQEYYEIALAHYKKCAAHAVKMAKLAAAVYSIDYTITPVSYTHLTLPTIA